MRYGLAVLLALVCAAPADAQRVLDFQTEDDFETALTNGQDLSTPPEFGRIVRVGSSAGAHLGPAIFDSDPLGPNGQPSLRDADLLVDSGGILILQDVAFPQQSVPGFYDVPDDARNGGQLIFEFLEAQGEWPLSMDVIDLDEDSVTEFVLVDINGLSRTIEVPPNFTGDITAGGAGIATVSFAEPTAAPNPMSGSTVVDSDAGFDMRSVVRLEVILRESSALDNLVLACLDGLSCSDGDSCTRTDMCADAVCVGQPLECRDDEDPCTVAACDAGQCVQLPRAEGAACEDGNVCTATGACLEGVCVTVPRRDRVPCDDGDVCTLKDLCDAGQCVGIADPGCELCDEDADCSGAEQCFIAVCEAGRCQSVPSEDGSDCAVEDGNVCTAPAGACMAGTCVLPANDGPCDDGDPCTLDDTCADGACSGIQDPECQACTADEDCDDDVFCNGAEICLEGACRPSETPACPPGLMCDEQADACRAMCACQPPGIAASCENPDGATVNYALPELEAEACAFVCSTGDREAAGAAGEGCTVHCDPPPGSFFPIGSTDVSCTIVDPGGEAFFSGCELTIVVGGGCGAPPPSGNDRDRDGVLDEDDNCPDTRNGPGEAEISGVGDQTDSDEDDTGDACDPCPNDPLDDADGDGVCADRDGCPQDPDKSSPGRCGCGEPDVFSDGDSVPDCLDDCPRDSRKTEPGQCGCGIVDDDSDGDQLADCVDDCPNDGLNDIDRDTICGDVDNCPSVFNPDQLDTDGDGLGDDCDVPQVEPALPQSKPPVPLDGLDLEPVCGCGSAGPLSAALLLLGLTAMRFRSRRWFMSGPRHGP